MNIPAPLTDLLARLEGEQMDLLARVADLDQQIDSVRHTIELLGSHQPAPAPTSEAKPAAQPKPTSRPTMDPVACPDCGEMFDPRGLGPHRRAKHPTPAPRVGLGTAADDHVALAFEERLDNAPLIAGETPDERVDDAEVITIPKFDPEAARARAADQIR